ncbi:MAG: T9SS type A sorting domain-containing protein, partial [Bacteroidota bacterium]
GRLSAFGNSQAQTKYHFKDGQALKGERYYRLKQVDADGSFVYSPIVQVNNNSGRADFSLYPNPSKEQRVFLQNPSKGERPINIQLYSADGQLQSISIVEDVEAGTTQIDLHELASGLYTLVIESAQHVTYKKLLKL